MTAHELANLLLSLPDLPVATTALNHTAVSTTGDGIKVGRLYHYTGDYIVIGDISKRNINRPNWYVTKMYHGDAPEEWPRSEE